jgi:DNA-binding IclR family transcriptional regulator
MIIDVARAATDAPLHDAADIRRPCREPCGCHGDIGTAQMERQYLPAFFPFSETNAGRMPAPRKRCLCRKLPVIFWAKAQNRPARSAAVPVSNRRKIPRRHPPALPLSQYLEILYDVPNGRHGRFIRTMQNRASPASTVGRAVDLLRLIASSPSQHLRLVDLARRADLEKSTAHRLLQRLVSERMLVRIPGQRGYRLGPLIYELGLCALPENNLRETCHPHLKRLAEQSGDMAFLVARSGFETVCLDRIAGDFHIQTLTSGIGDRHPLGIGVGGLAILAAMSDEEIEIALHAVHDMLSRYPNFSVASLRAAIARTRQAGYAMDEGVAAAGVSAIGMDIRHPGGMPAAAVFITTISPRMDPARRSVLAKYLAACVKGVHADMSRGGAAQLSRYCAGPPRSR